MFSSLTGATINIFGARKANDHELCHLLTTSHNTINIFGTLKGFFASAVKRATSVKDFAGYIPGHGGFTDRMDCQLIMAVAAWAVYAVCMPQVASQVGHFKHAVAMDNGSFNE
jgi:CDP-diglyceride synthetase